MSSWFNQKNKSKHASTKRRSTQRSQRQTLQSRKYKIMLLGPSGAGKTSLYNLIENARRFQREGLTFHNANNYRCYNDREIENAPEDIMASKTSGATAYDIRNFPVGKNQTAWFRFIDTPGLADSRGPGQDKLNKKAVMNFLEKEKTVDAIILVLNGRESKMDATRSFVLHELCLFFPKDVVDRIIVLFTNVRNIVECNWDFKKLEKFLCSSKSSSTAFHDRILMLENPFSLLQQAKKKGCLETGTQRHLLLRSLNNDFTSAIDLLQDIGKRIVNCQQQPMVTKAFLEVHQQRMEIEFKSRELVEQLRNCYKHEDDMRKLREALLHAKTQKQLNAEWKKKRVIERWVQTPTATYNTQCSVLGCHSNCHVGCGLKFSAGGDIFKGCAAEIPKCCGHGINVHFHSYCVWEKVLEESEHIVEDMKRQFEEYGDLEEDRQAKLAHLEKKKKRLHDERASIADKIHALISDFQNKAIRHSYADVLKSQILYLGQCIKGFQKEGKAIDVKLMEAKSKLETLYDELYPGAQINLTPVATQTVPADVLDNVASMPIPTQGGKKINYWTEFWAILEENLEDEDTIFEDNDAKLKLREARDVLSIIRDCKLKDVAKTDPGLKHLKGKTKGEIQQELSNCDESVKYEIENGSTPGQQGSGACLGG